jgi:Transmembrane Fragile-X-F protein.
MRLLEWLTILFIALKLTDEIDWEWWLVLSPLWSAFLIALLSNIYKRMQNENAMGSKSRNKRRGRDES